MDSRSPFWLVGLLMVVWLATPALAFGAGNISSSSPIEGVNWRHGDIEDALLGILMARAINRKGKNFPSAFATAMGTSGCCFFPR